MDSFREVRARLASGWKVIPSAIGIFEELSEIVEVECGAEAVPPWESVGWIRAACGAECDCGGGGGGRDEEFVVDALFAVEGVVSCEEGERGEEGGIFTVWRGGYSNDLGGGVVFGFRVEVGSAGGEIGGWGVGD